MDRCLQRSQRERRVDAHGDCVAHGLATASVQDDCKVAEPDSDSNVGDVRNPDQIQLGRNHVAVEVGEDRSVVIAVGGSNEAAPTLDPQAMLGHDTRDALMVDGMVAPTQFVCDASVSVAWQLVLDAADQFDQVLIRQA